MRDIRELQYFQRLPLNIKVEMTKQRIRGWYEHYNGDVYVSFSGGKDSTVLLSIARQMYRTIPAMFIDTGLEYPEIRQFVKTFDNIDIVRPEMSFRDVIIKYGYPIVSKEVASDIQSAKNKPNGRTMQKFVRDSDYHKKYGDRFLMDRWAFLLDAPFKTSKQCCNVMKKKTCSLVRKRIRKHISYLGDYDRRERFEKKQMVKVWV